MPDKPFTVRLLDGNIAEVTLKDKVHLDVSVTDELDRELERLAPSTKVYQLVIASATYIVNPEMRHAFAENDTGLRQLAIAWVSPDEKANREQEEVVNKLTLPTPIRFFNDRNLALKWLCNH